MKFFSCEADSVLEGDLIYREAEYSVDFISVSPRHLRSRIGCQGCISLTIGTLQIEVGIETKLLIYPWGFLPLVNVKKEKIEIPIFKRGGIKVDLCGLELVEGVSFEVLESGSWKTISDCESGWIYIGGGEALKNVCYYEFAAGAVLGICNGDIVCIYIRLQFFSD